MTVRLCAVAVERWDDLDGWAVSKNLPNLGTLPLERFTHMMWFWLTDGGEQKDIDKLRAQLWRPPPGVIPTRGPWSPEAETASFMALKRSVAK